MPSCSLAIPTNRYLRLNTLKSETLLFPLLTCPTHILPHWSFSIIVNVLLPVAQAKHLGVILRCSLHISKSRQLFLQSISRISASTSHLPLQCCPDSYHLSPGLVQEHPNWSLLVNTAAKMSLLKHKPAHGTLPNILWQLGISFRVKPKKSLLWPTEPCKPCLLLTSYCPSLTLSAPVTPASFCSWTGEMPPGMFFPHTPKYPASSPPSSLHSNIILFKKKELEF